MKLAAVAPHPKDYYEATFPLLAATLFSHLAFEAFLNDMGSRLRPDVWTKERTFFSQGDFRGELGKLSLLLQSGGAVGCRRRDRVRLALDASGRPIFRDLRVAAGKSAATVNEQLEAAIVSAIPPTEQ